MAAAAALAPPGPAREKSAEVAAAPARPCHREVSGGGGGPSPAWLEGSQWRLWRPGPQLAREKSAEVAV
ncbi:hypothetical protein P7K49_000648, partial [Saguinus oedipus]